MTAATITNNLEINDPTKEVVVLTASDNDTYISRKFGTILAANATPNEDGIDTAIGVTYDGATATIRWTSIVTKKLTLTLYGRK